MAKESDGDLQREFLRALREIVRSIPLFSDARRIILPGNTIGRYQRHIVRIAREDGIQLPEIVRVPSMVFPEHYVVGRGRNDRDMIPPQGRSIVIEDAHKTGEKVWRMKTANPNIRVLLVASVTNSPNADVVARPWHATLVRWLLQGQTDESRRSTRPIRLSRFR